MKIVKQIMNLQELNNKTIQWGQDRGFYSSQGTTVEKQFVKLIEEVGELAGNLARGKCVKDDLGDFLVVLTHICKLSNTSIEEVWNVAYNDIKDRKGKFINGIYVKESDIQV